MSTFAQVGDFGPNTACSDHGKPQSEHQQNIIKFGKTQAGRQRFKCKTCGNTFTETKGTIFSRRRTPENEIIETLALIAEGSRISSLARVRELTTNTLPTTSQHKKRSIEALEVP
jgi:transposase-like protein